jgi:hypothetical protein
VLAPQRESGQRQEEANERAGEPDDQGLNFTAASTAHDQLLDRTEAEECRHENPQRRGRTA